MLPEIQDAIREYYLNPITGDTGYNVVNTITWAVVLAICIFPVLSMIRRLGVTIDRRFMIGVISYVLFGSSLRVLEDARIFTPPISYAFETPNIYFVVFVITVLSLAVSLRIYKERYHIPFSIVGLGLASVNIGLLLRSGGIEITYPKEAIMIVALAILGTGLVYLCAGRMKIGFLRDRFNIAILGAHLLDASSTTIGVDLLGYHGKHVVEKYLIGIAGTGAVMYPLKLLVFIPALYIIENEMNEPGEVELRDLLKLVILVLGLSPGFRNTIRILFGV